MLFEVHFKKLVTHACLPEFKTTHASGGDLRSVEDVVIYPGARTAVGCGFAMSFRAGIEAQIRPRSGLALKHGVTVLNSPGTIDADFRGEVRVILINHGEKPFTVNRGDRIAQMVFAQIEYPIIKEVKELNETSRGEGGFGSTGIN